MKVKLTDRFCSNVKAESRVDYFDEVTTGLAARSEVKEGNDPRLTQTDGMT